MDKEIEAFARMKADLEQHHLHKFVVIADGELKGAFDTLDNAAAFSRENFGSGPYLIREVGKTYGPLPASVMYRPIEAA